VPVSFEAFGAAIVDSLDELPFLLLQGAAVVGMVSVLLLVKRDLPFDDIRYKVRFGIVFGLTGFVLTMLVSEFIQMPSKPYLRADPLFLAGLLGGWHGGLICLALIAAGRVMFGGLHQLLAAMIDLAIVSIGGIALHGWFNRRPMARLGWRDLGLCFGVREIIVLGAAVVVYAIGLISPAVFLSSLARRLSAIAVSLPITGAVFMLLRGEALAREQSEKREQAALTDMLTGLPNRRALREHIAAPPPSWPSGERVIVLFEVINMAEMYSVHGDDWSDAFWPQLARHLESPAIDELLAPCRPRIFLFSDTTLAMVLHDTSAQKLELTGRMAHLHAELTALLQGQDAENEPVPQLRIGAATLDAGLGLGREAASSLRNISLALRGSDNAVQIFPRSFAQKAQADEYARRMLVEWIRLGTPPLHYQPKFSLRDMRIVGGEALLRCVDEQGAPLPPPYLLEIAERHRLLPGLEWSTVQAVVRDLRRMDRSIIDIGLAVNLSAVSFVTAGFGERLVALLADQGVAPNRLSIEVMETSKVPSIDIVQHNFDILRHSGVKLSLDDFGNGYAALTTLALYPFREVKIDRWMVASIGQPRIRQAIALAAESAKRYGAELVIEGIETEEQRRTLLDMGIETGQGFLCSPSLPLEGFTALVSRARPHGVPGPAHARIEPV